MDIEGDKVPSTAVFRSPNSKDPKMKLYHSPACPYCMSTMMLAKALKLELQEETFNLLAGEHLNPEFIKLNPQHTVPTLVHDDFVIWDSHAIMQYLVNLYDKDRTYVPRNPRETATLQQRMMFVATTLGPRLGGYYVPVIKGNEDVDPDKFETLIEAIEWLEGFLEQNEYVAGPKMTVVDFNVVALISIMDCMNIPLRKYTYLWSWYVKMKGELDDFGYKEITQEGAKMVGDMFREKTNDLF